MPSIVSTLNAQIRATQHLESHIHQVILHREHLLHQAVAQQTIYMYMILVLSLVMTIVWLYTDFSDIALPKIKLPKRKSKPPHKLLFDPYKIHKLEHELGLPPSDYTRWHVQSPDYIAASITDIAKFSQETERVLHPPSKEEKLREMVVNAHGIPPHNLRPGAYLTPVQESVASTGTKTVVYQSIGDHTFRPHEILDAVSRREHSNGYVVTDVTMIEEMQDGMGNISQSWQVTLCPTSTRHTDKTHDLACPVCGGTTQTSHIQPMDQLYPVEMCHSCYKCGFQSSSRRVPKRFAGPIQISAESQSTRGKLGK